MEASPNGKLVARASAAYVLAPKPYMGEQGFGEPGCSTIIHSKKRKSMKANFKGELDMAIPCELLKVNMLSERQSSQKSPNRVEQFLAELLGLHTICLQSISLISAAIYESCLFHLSNATLQREGEKGRENKRDKDGKTDRQA